METKITGNNSVVPLNKVKDNTSVFVRLWQRGKEILTPLREVLDSWFSGESIGKNSIAIAKDSKAVCDGSVENTSAVTINLGTRPGSGGIETKSTTLNALCAMQFMCCLKQTTQVAAYVQWAPLGNATVTWS